MHEAQRPDSPPAPARGSELQVEQVALALQQLRQTNDALHESESRLAEMTRDCAAILDRWAKNDERHAAAVGELHARLGEWNDLERKLLSESATRIHQFERSLQHEWNAIRQKHEEPIQRLDEQARRITDSCLTAIDSALKGFDRAEARLLAIEQQMSRDMSDLSRDVREALTELRQSVQLGPRQPWSLDNVVRLHNELRAEADDTGDVVLSGSGTAVATAPALATMPHAAPHERVARTPIFKDVTPDVPVHEPVAAAQPSETQPDGSLRADSAPSVSRRWVLGAVVLTLALVVAGIAMYSRVEQQLAQATARAAAAEHSVAETREVSRQQLADARRAADDRIASAQLAADRAQRLATIVAAGDARRFDLTTGDAAAGAPAAQLLWSRVHGISASASGLPAAPPDQRYIVWLVAAGAPVSIGALTSDGAGRASLVGPLPPTLPRPVTGAFITLERETSPARPTGTPLVATRPAAASAP